MNGKSYPVVVGVDGSFAAIRAAAVAEEFGAPLQILHLKPDRTSSDAIADPTAAEMAARRESAEAIVQAAEQAVRAHFKGLHIACAQVVGSAGQALVESSRVARLIVLGTDELSPGRAVLVGSTTMSVAAHSTCPVVARRGGATSPTQRPIVVGVNHDHASRVAITAAFEFAHRLGLGNHRCSCLDDAATGR